MGTACSRWSSSAMADGLSVIASNQVLPAAATVLYVPALSRRRPSLMDRLAVPGVSITTAATMADAAAALDARPFTMCLVDLIDGRGAIALVRVAHAKHPSMSIVGIVDPARPVAAAEALQAGAVDVLPWPFEDSDWLTLMANVRDRSRSVEDDRVTETNGAGPIIFGQSLAMQEVVDAMREAATHRQSLAICGEQSSGRRTVARALHAAAGGTAEGFVVVECAGRTAGDLEQELFGRLGHERDSGRPGAMERLGQDGAVARSMAGTLLLRDVADAPARIQARLARVFRDGEAWLVEARTRIELDVRVIESSNGDHARAVADGRLRKDLAERWAHARIDVPPLRRRRDDIPLLCVHFVREICSESGIPAKGFSRAAVALLSALPWPGNGAELRGLIKGVARSVRQSVIQVDDILEHASFEGVTARIDTNQTLRQAREQFERDCISAVLLRHHGRVGEAAKALGIQRTNLYRKVRQLKVAKSLLTPRK